MFVFVVVFFLSFFRTNTRFVVVVVVLTVSHVELPAAEGAAVVGADEEAAAVGVVVRGVESAVVETGTTGTEVI